ncbi:MAG: DUF4282 domain-containing protein [Caulobacteraceae bacterium]|nr:DUF4282 domain-containing protein [Caulobacteraceae bacterium]
MSPAASKRNPASRGLFWDLLTFDRLIAGSLIHLVYWAGLGIIALMGFFAVGAAAGLALHNDGAAGWLLAVPALVGGALAVLALGLIWRASCEFYVAILRISDDLRAIRQNDEAAQAAAAAKAAAAANRTQTY